MERARLCTQRGFRAIIMGQLDGRVFHFATSERERERSDLTKSRDRSNKAINE